MNNIDYKLDDVRTINSYSQIKNRSKNSKLIFKQRKIKTPQNHIETHKTNIFIIWKI